MLMHVAMTPTNDKEMSLMTSFSTPPEQDFPPAEQIRLHDALSLLSPEWGELVWHNKVDLVAAAEGKVAVDGQDEEVRLYLFRDESGYQTLNPHDGHCEPATLIDGDGLRCSITDPLGREEAIRQWRAGFVKSNCGLPTPSLLRFSVIEHSDEAFLRELAEMDEDPVPSASGWRCSREEHRVEAFEIGEDSYQLSHYGDNGPVLLRWWNGIDGIVVGGVWPDQDEGDVQYHASVRVDRRDCHSEGMDPIGFYRSVAGAKQAMIEAYTKRWHSRPEPSNCDWRQGF
jgi:hypothetical protein